MTYMPIWEKHLNMFEEIGLEDAQRGRLITMMMEYHFRGEQPEELEPELKAIWFFLRQDLDAARRQYMQSVENGKKGAEKRRAATRKQAGTSRSKPEEAGTSQNELEQAETSQSKPEEAITRTRTGSRTGSRTESRTRTESGTRTESRTETETGSAPADAGVSAEQRAYGEFGWVKLTDRQYRQLQAKMGEQTLETCIRYIDRSAQSTGNCNRWKDWYLVLSRCYEEGWHEPRRYPHTDPIPKGASGHLGEAELEAIRRVLSEEI